MSTLRSLARLFGYGRTQSGSGVQVFRYLRQDGSFDYERYKRVQTAGNRKKIDKVWVIEENIKFLADYIRGAVGEVRFGLCHGTRRGMEQEWFRESLGAEVIGTEISDTATQFPHTIEWDFHEVKPEWIGSVDFIYSNSFDHSHDPRACLDAWMQCIRPGGVCIIEHSSRHERATELDPFGAHVSEMPYLVLTWGEGRYAVTRILDAPVQHGAYTQFLVIRNLNQGE